jgi:hypothetical protein
MTDLEPTSATSNGRHLGYAGAAAVVAASTFIPLPLVDDWVASLSRRQLVAAALARHGRTFSVGDLKPLYDNGGSLLGLPWRFAKGLVLLPIKKVLAKVLIVFAVRDVVLAVGKTIALGHTLERELRLGLFRDDDGRDKRRDDAARLRKALDGAYAGIDQRLVKRAATAAIARVRGAPADGGDVESFLARAHLLELALARAVLRALRDLVAVGVAELAPAPVEELRGARDFLDAAIAQVRELAFGVRAQLGARPALAELERRRRRRARPA